VLTDRTRLSAPDRRTRILDSARHEFARKGFKGAGTAEIAARASCSEPTLYKYFASKHALFAAVLDDSSRRMGERVDAQVANADDPVAAWLENVAEQAATDPDIVEHVRLRMLAMSLVDDPAVRDAIKRSAAAMRERTMRILLTARERGQLRPDIDVEAASWLWFGFTLAGGFAHALDPTLAASTCPRMAHAFVRLLRPLETP
jgi:AcrR family transcriptional regulator